MRVALAQINSVLGDFASNKDKILAFTKRAVDRRCDLVVFPECALFGYHPCDLLERPSVVDEQVKHLHDLAKKIPKNITVIVGAIVPNPHKNGKPFWNAALVLEKGKKPRPFAKELLPTYDVFDEGRHIEPGQLEKNIIKIKGQRVLITICEDIWAWAPGLIRQGSMYVENPLKRVKPGRVDLVVNLSASPFTETKIKNRQFVTKKTVGHFKTPMVYVNLVGGQDELIFDGGSFALNKKGKIISQCVHFEEDLSVVDFKTNTGSHLNEKIEPIEELRQALVLGLRDFANKTGLQRVHLGLSGGIDSALVACLAVDALGAQRVTCIGMPGPFSAPESLTWAKKLAKNVGAEWVELPISESYENVLKSWQQAYGKIEFGTVHENLQARLRGMSLMAFSNLRTSILLNTSNKSELATGYSTLYGDLTGGLCVIGDLLKTKVYELARFYNREREIIPNEIIERAPSAELRPNQTDQDTLPPYDELDKIVKKIVADCKPATGETEKKVLGMLYGSEFKRWQAPPILKVTDHAFGRGRRLPVAHRARS